MLRKYIRRASDTRRSRMCTRAATAREGRGDDPTGRRGRDREEAPRSQAARGNHARLSGKKSGEREEITASELDAQLVATTSQPAVAAHLVPSRHEARGAECERGWAPGITVKAGASGRAEISARRGLHEGRCPCTRCGRHRYATEHGEDDVGTIGVKVWIFRGGSSRTAGGKTYSRGSNYGSTRGTGRTWKHDPTAAPFTRDQAMLHVPSESNSEDFKGG